MKIFNNKKGQIFDNIGRLAIGLGTFAVVIVVTFLIMAQAQDQIIDVQGITNESNASQQTTAYNATVTTQTALESVPAWIPIIVVVTIGALLIGLISVFRRVGR